MSGKVLRTLQSSPWLSPLTYAELLALAACGHISSYQPGESILDAGDETTYILRQGRVGLHVSMMTEGNRCGGEADFELAMPGDAFGWATWARPDRIVASAWAMDNTELATLHLDRVKDSVTLAKVGLRMVQNLYSRLQEGGLCPSNVRAFLKLGDARCVFPETYAQEVPW